MNENKVTAKNLLKFILGSAFGILMFLVPVPKDDSFTTLLDFIKGYIKTLFGNSLPYVLMVLMIISGVLTLYNFICKPDWINKNALLKKGFSASPFYLLSKELGMIFAIMVVCGVGPEWILSADTGARITTITTKPIVAIIPAP